MELPGEIAIMLGEVQLLASRVLQEKGRLASSSGSSMSSTVAGRNMSYTPRTSSEGSSTRFTYGSQNDVLQLTAGLQKHNISSAHKLECTTDTMQYTGMNCQCDLPSLGSVSARKNAYMQAAANTPSSTSSSTASAAPCASSSSSIRAPPEDAAVLPSLAALRKSWLEASSSVDLRTAEAAAAAAEAAKAEAAAETAAGGISVSALRSSWLETQRQEAEAAAAAAAALAAAKARASPSRRPHPHLVHARSAPLVATPCAAAAAKDLPLELPRPVPRRVTPSPPSPVQNRSQVAYTIDGSIILDKSKEVCDMAERLLKARAKSDAAGDVTSRVLSGALATAKSLELPYPTVAPVACGGAAAVDLDM